MLMDKVKIMNDKAKDFICKHIDSDRIIESVSMTSDFKTHNKEMKKLDELVKSISQDIGLCEIVYSELLSSENPVTLLNSESECLKINIFVEQAVKTLKLLAKRKDIGIISFNAQMMLSEWRKLNK